MVLLLKLQHPFWITRSPRYNHIPVLEISPGYALRPADSAG